MKLEDRLSDLSKSVELINNPAISLDLVSSLCGEFLGEGNFRKVFQYNLNPDYVIKIEKGNTDCNTIEHMVWDEVKGLCNNLAWVKDWFAPVSWISPNGRILVMKKTKNYPKRIKPSKVPAFLWDVKPDNFGWFGKNYVCHDYGQFYNMIDYKTKKIKIDWNKY